MSDRLSALRPMAHPSRAFAVVLLLFTAGRAAFVALHGGAFAGLSGEEIALAFLRGLAFDVAAILRYLSVPLVLLAVPVAPRFEDAWRRLWGWAAFGGAALLALLIAIDLAYFPYLHRHAGAEILLVREETAGIAALLVTDYAGAVAGLLALWTALVVVWRRWVLADGPSSAAAVRGGRAWAVAALTLLVVCAGARAGPVGPRLLTTHAHRGATADAALLTLNGPFVVWELMAGGGADGAASLPWDEAVTAARAAVFREGERPVGDDFPLARSASAPRARGAEAPHVVLLVLEGWSADAVDVLRASRGLDPLGATPAFDRLAARSRLFTRAYAAGQRTNHGYTALLTGLAPSPHVPLLTKGLAARDVPTLPWLARNHGYGTTLVLGSPRGSQDIEAVAQAVGFDRVVAAEDLEGTGGVPVPLGRCADAHVLATVRRLLDEATRPALIVVKTQDTHAPYPRAAPAPVRAPATGARKQFLDVLHASDAALGAFFDGVLATDAGRRTVFVVVSDHIQRIDARQRVRAPDLFWIPMMILGPGVAPGADARVASQTDVLPTLADLLGWDDVHASVGVPLLADARPPFAGATCAFGDTIVRIEPGGWVAHDLTSRVDGEAFLPDGDLDAVERRLRAVEQVVRSMYVLDRTVPR